jgi:hypothetical protein
VTGPFGCATPRWTVRAAVAVGDERVSACQTRGRRTREGCGAAGEKGGAISFHLGHFCCSFALNRMYLLQSVMMTMRRGRTCTFLIRPLCSSSLYLVCCPDIPFGLWSLLFPVLVCLVYGCQLDLIACVSCSWLSSSTCWAAYILTLHIGVGNNNIY